MVTFPTLRILKGTALYTSDFTPPTHALEVIGGTVLLCCNNPDSAGAASNATLERLSQSMETQQHQHSLQDSPETSHLAQSSEGVTTFDTQGYFVPPSGTRTERDRVRGPVLVVFLVVGNRSYLIQLII